MIGVFDSGAGGLVAFGELRRLLPKADMCYYADRENAPYGTKTKEQIRALVMRDIDILKAAGADNILIACCTACSVYDSLPYEYRAVSTPIIMPAAVAAATVSSCGHIAVLCTEATAASGVFEDEIRAVKPNARVTVQPSATLVSLVEDGVRDRCMTPDIREKIKGELSGLYGCGADTVILGCTHFSHIGKTVSELLSMRAVSAAHEGARYMAELLAPNIKNSENKKSGKISFIARRQALNSRETENKNGKLQTRKNKRCG